MSTDSRSDPHDGGAARADAQGELVRAELRRVYIAQGARAPVLAMLVIGMLFWTLRQEIPLPWLTGWAAVVALLLLLRWGACVAFARADIPADKLPGRMRTVVALRVAGGLALGSGAILWWPQLQLYDKLIFMVACLGWYATTVIVSLASPAAALLFGVSMLGPTAIAWSSQQDVQGVFIAALTIALVFLIRQSSEGAHAAIRGAIRSRLREEDLARRLERHGTELEAAMRAKSQFLAAASHDLRQPVTSMNLLLTALNASRDETALRGIAAKFEAPLTALEEILSSLLEVSRLEAGIIEVQRRPCSAEEIVAPLVAEYRPRAAARRTRLESRVPSLRLYTDPELVRRMLRNLLDNAVKFTEAGTVRVTAQEDGDALVLTVADSGLGIPQEHLSQVFDDYFQGDNPQRDRRQGLGLGLAIVRRIVDLLGGDTELHSERGKGTRVLLRLPGAIDRFPGSEEAAAAQGEQLLLPASSVLVVEDDRLVVDALSTLFSTLGIRARFALDGEDALMQTALGRFVPDLALVDHGLPGRYDGISLVRTLRDRLPRCRFLLVTGDTRPEVIRRAADEGVPVLHKPVTVERLNEKLRELGVGV